MKKNIGFVPLDPSLAAWLLEKLTKEPPVSDCAEAVSYTHLTLPTMVRV